MYRAAFRNSPARPHHLINVIEVKGPPQVQRILLPFVLVWWQISAPGVKVIDMRSNAIIRIKAKKGIRNAEEYSLCRFGFCQCIHLHDGLAQGYSIRKHTRPVFG